MAQRPERKAGDDGEEDAKRTDYRSKNAPDARLRRCRHAAIVGVVTRAGNPVATKRGSARTNGGYIWRKRCR